MRKIIIKAKNKKQEKAVKEFLDSHDIDYSSVIQEEPAAYITKKTTTSKKHNKAKEKLIAEIKEAVKYINLVKQGKRKAKSAKELLDEL